MEDLYTALMGESDSPHRHEYYTILFIEKADGVHIIDYQVFPMQNSEVHFVGPGQVHQVKATIKPVGWVLTFTTDFLAINNIPGHFISNINLFRPFGYSPPLPLDAETFGRLQSIALDMQTCNHKALRYANNALGALLQLFLIYCNNSCSMDTTQLDEEKPNICILRDFKELVEAKFTDWHKVGEYASEIHITPKHLSQTLKELTGKTAKELIQDRLLVEAKRLLLHTNLSIKDVAYQLGFEEPLHFSGFFRQKTTLSPSSFREEQG